MWEWLKKRLESLFDNALFALFFAVVYVVIATIKSQPLPVIIGVFFGILIIILFAIRLIMMLVKRRHTVNETKALDGITCDKCGFIGVRNIKTRELEEMEDNQRRTGQPVLTRINSLGDTEPRHEKIPECIMQAEDFAALPPLSSQPLPLFYMQLPRQCPQFIKWQKGLSPKEHKESSAIPDMLKSPRPPELQISYQKHVFGVFNGEPIITVYAEYRPTGTMRIEAIELRLVGERKPSLDWEVYEVEQDVWITSDNKFKVPDGISPGAHNVTLAAFANGEWWGSHPFTIAFPEVNS